MRAWVAGGVVVLTFLVSSVALAASAQTDVEGRRKALNDLLAERWEYTLRTSPIFASILGDKRWNDKLDDFSQKAIDDDLEQSKKDLARFEAIDTTGFPEQEILNKTLMVRDCRCRWRERVSSHGKCRCRNSAGCIRFCRNWSAWCRSRT
jgi:uncharacterized protein (DUF885 family)